MSTSLLRHKLLVLTGLAVVAIGGTSLLRGRSTEPVVHERVRESRSTARSLEAHGAVAEATPSSPSRLGDEPSVDESSVDDAEQAKVARLILGRPWFDRLPKSRKDDIDLWVFLGGGFGLEEKGSNYRFSLEFFEFERQGNKVDIQFLQDAKRELRGFELVECHDKPPFDLCLDFKEPLRGQKRLYSFDDESDMDAAIPWAREWRTTSAARVQALR